MSQLICVDDHCLDAALFRRSIIRWGHRHFRAFPWRLSQNPYHILMAELMLHRTQVIQVVPIYQLFMAKYPTLTLLAQANDEDLHSILRPLGLQWRIDLIHTLASTLMDQFGGRIPHSKEELVSLPGVSDYIASAVRCFAWNEPEAIIDTNSVRVVGRVFGLEIKDSSRRNARYRNILNGLLDPKCPSAYNYSILDLAGSVCTKIRSPDCLACPVLKWCIHGAGIVGKLQP